MLFSVIIPTYNRQTTLVRAINSVLAQTYSNFEIVIIDDGSTDDTANVVAGLNNNKIIYQHTENYGVAHARNLGILHAAGDYIGFLDSDDLYETEHLNNAIVLIQKNNYPEIVHLNFLYGPENRHSVNKNNLPHDLPADLFKACSLHVNCIFIKSEIAKKHLFNEARELMFVEDWDFFIKLAVRFPIHLCDICSAYLVDHDDRNMKKFDERRWEQKRDALQQSLRLDKVVSHQYAEKILLVVAHMNSLIAVNLASRKSKLKALHYFFLSLSQSPAELFTKRGGAIIKHLLFNW